MKKRNNTKNGDAHGNKKKEVTETGKREARDRKRK